MCAFFRLLLYHILYLDYSILNCFFNCMSWLLWPMRTERRVTITVFQLGALLNRGKFCTVSYWITWMLNHLLLVQNLTSGKVKTPSSIFVLRQIQFINLHVQRMQLELAHYCEIHNESLCCQAMQPSAGNGPIEIYVTTMEELCPTPI